jgi:hypothetical protein
VFSHLDQKDVHLPGHYPINLDETGLKFKYKMEAVMAPYKVYKGMQKKAKKDHLFLHEVLSVPLYHDSCQP